MSEADTEVVDIPDYVPHFLYLDMDQVKSISARMGGGYIKEQIEGDEEVHEEAESLRGRIMASIFNIGSEVEGEVTTTDAESSHTESVRGLHHYHYTLLEAELEKAEDEWFYDYNSRADEFDMDGESAIERFYESEFRSEISEGDIIRISGNMEVSDVARSLDLFSGMLSMFADMKELQEMGFTSFDFDDEEIFDEDSELSDMDFRKRKEVLQKLLNMVSNILPDEYENMIMAELYPLSFNDEHSVWSILDETKLETSPVELMAKYEEQKIPNCTILARVETVTQNSSDEVDLSDVDGGNIGMIHHLADGFAAQLGLKADYPSISVTPIAIYR